MRELIQNTALSSSDKAIFIAGAAIVIVLILVILYKIDQMPPEYQKRKKTKVKKEKKEKIKTKKNNILPADIENYIDKLDESAEEKMEKLFSQDDEIDKDEYMPEIERNSPMEEVDIYRSEKLELPEEEIFEEEQEKVEEIKEDVVEKVEEVKDISI